jgi:ribonuclease BN (tRNA processing enzyme)
MPFLLRAYPMLTIESDHNEEPWCGFRIFGVEVDHSIDFVRKCFAKLSHCSLVSSSSSDAAESSIDNSERSSVKLTSISIDSSWKCSFGSESRKVSLSEVDKLFIIKSIGCTDTVPPPNPFGDIFTITFLGTGSAKPSKYRSSSSILITVLPLSDFSILLDVGENAVSQLFQSVSGDLSRFYDCLRGIRVIWISHHHADHASGFTMLIHHIHKAHQYHKRNLPSKVVMIIGSEAVLKFCEFISVIAGIEDLLEFIPIQNSLYAGLKTKIFEFTKGNVRHLQSVPVSHCQDSFAAVIELSNSFKIAYSGDCRPSQSFINLGLNCDLLIHEATFDTEKLQDAIRKRHSTISEALHVSSLMRAKHTILTHFSQRYPAVHINADSFDCANISVASDFLRISFPSQVPYAPKTTMQITEILANSRSVNLNKEVAN